MGDHLAVGFYAAHARPAPERLLSNGGRSTEEVASHTKIEERQWLREFTSLETENRPPVPAFQTRDNRETRDTPGRVPLAVVDRR